MGTVRARTRSSCLMSDEDSLLTSREVTEMASISAATLYRLIARGEFPPGITLGVKVRRWRRSQIWEYVAGRELESCG